MMNTFKILLLLVFLLLAACTNHTSIALHKAQADFNQQNYTAAFAQANTLANKGHPQAQYALGYMYFYGKGTLPDPDIGRLWIQRAAAQGYQPAIQALQVLDAPVIK